MSGEQKDTDWPAKPPASPETVNLADIGNCQQYPAEAPQSALLNSWKLLLWVQSGVLVLIVAGFLFGGIVKELATAALYDVPFVVLAQLTYIGTSRRWARVLSVLWLALLLLAAGLFAVGAAGMTAGGSNNDAARREMGWATLLCFVVFGLLLCTLNHRLRRQIARLLPISAESSVHIVALWTVVFCTACLLIPLVVTGETLLSAMLKRGELDDAARQTTMLTQLFNLAWLIPATFLAAGLGIRRTFAETLERLGLSSCSRKQLVVSALAGLGISIVGDLLLEPFVTYVWQSVGWPVTDQAPLTKLFAQLLTPAGVIVTSICAGVGEELAMRGLVQRRMGILLTNVLFISLHAPQYHWDVLSLLFLLTLVLGWVRQRYNTVLCITIHTTYDIGAFMSWYLRRPRR